MVRIPLLFCCVLFASAALADIDLQIAYLRQEVEAPPTLSNLDKIPDNMGIAGAEVALQESKTTGSFLGHNYELGVRSIAPGQGVIEQAKEVLAQTRLLLVDAPATELLAIADLPEAKGALIFNVAAPETSLRSNDCRRNILHALPSLAMRTDALSQFLQKKRWDDLVLIAGTHPQDQAYAVALKQSLTKFGLKLDGEKIWAFDADMRRNAAQEVPLFTQELGDYDALLIADEIGDFGRYVLYNTWQPRPVAGSEGLNAVTWSPAVEQWGAAQLQQRFHEATNRTMLPKDYAAWAALRSIAEAVIRTSSGDPVVLRDYILSDEFELAGFKGRPLSYRNWNGQLRQPIPIVHPRALVAQAPLEGFLHQRTELDTLGLDKPESACQAFGG
ncbi:MAG: ABC transporter substrate-binding protein [Stappiaceae bacterium]